MIKEFDIVKVIVGIRNLKAFVKAKMNFKASKMELKNSGRNRVRRLHGAAAAAAPMLLLPPQQLHTMTRNLRENAYST